MAKRKEKTDEQIIASPDVKAVKNTACKLQLDEAIKSKPYLIAISRRFFMQDNLDEYINYAIVYPPKGYEYSSYDIRHITVDDMQIIFFYKRKEIKTTKLFE